MYRVLSCECQNTRYVVVSGARQKEEDWDPEENGGFAVHGTYFAFAQPYYILNDLTTDTDPNAAPVDPLAALEKATDAQNHMNKVQIPRLEALQSHSDHYGSDPYALSQKARQKFRVEKKVEKERQAADDSLKGKYGLPETLALAAESDETRAQAKEEWLKGKQKLETQQNIKKRKLIDVGVVPRPPPALRTSSKTGARPSGSSSSSSAALESLRARILSNTARNSRNGRSKPSRDVS